ncbi:MAG: glycogen debranching enzyme family protein [Betaproteobacteria bacterium]|nr:glycogen debranching enzyme family protein [Betaproteobacteria bacterium]
MNSPQAPLIRFGREICGDIEQAERREWWLANGLGAYAAGTIAGTLTRRYHGLLVAPVDPPLGRRLVVAKADATLSDGVDSWPLFSNRWGGGVIAPAGHLNIESFELDGRIPVWRFACAGLRVEQRIWMEQGANTTYVAFRLLPDGGEPQRPLSLNIKLLANAHDHHGSARSGEFNPVIESGGADLRVRFPDWFALTLRARGGIIHGRHEWYENFDLPAERSRGLADRDNHLCVGEAALQLLPGEWVGVVASLDANPSPYLDEALRRARAADAGNLKRARVQVPELAQAPAWVDQLTLATASFIFARPLPEAPDGESVIAGYPWFGDWGRDTMIALPGLTLASGRFETARRILQTFARFVDQGMLPNVFPGAGDKPDYNTVDAALWYIEAWRAYVDTTHDKAALKDAFPVLESVIEWHIRGTRYGIGVDASDGLLRAGAPGVQLTWMDARIGDWVVTPRAGKPVEINALWFNALESMVQFADLLKLSREPYRTLALQVRQAFQRFVNEDAGGLYDVLDGPNGDDPSVRPNQIFAVSLPFSPLDRVIQERVVRQCGAELLTSYGLRSLTPSHADYKPYYRGGVRERDSSYHQGPAWGWLLGHYALAEFRVFGDAQSAQARLDPLRDHLLDAGLGTVSEIFDGGPPHAPGGAPSQAWSVACTLEAWWLLEKAKKQSATEDTEKGTSPPALSAYVEREPKAVMRA